MVIFDSTRPEVKPSRIRPFGRGVLAWTPSYKAPFTISDCEWWAAERAASEDRHVDRMAAESLGHDRLESGTIL